MSASAALRDELARAGEAILALPHGIHEGVPERVYHAPVLGMVSVGALTRMAQSPDHYRRWLDEPAEATAALEFGKLAHMALLEPHEYALQPAPTTKPGREMRETIAAMVARVHERRESDPPLAALLEGSARELTLRWKDGISGLECRARADVYVPDLGLVIDYKTTNDASEDAFARAAGDYGYHWIAAHYGNGFAAVGKPLNGYVFAVQEKKSPYAYAFRVLDDKALRLGQESVTRYSRKLAECMARKEWPAYGPVISIISLKPWVTT